VNLQASANVEGGNITDDYLPEETDAEELFLMWAKMMMEKYPDGLVPIRWGVKDPQKALYEWMPFQQHQPEWDFLTYFTWPVDVETGERLRWTDLPVMDKLWDEEHADPGGFIQSYTGWKPSIYQPYLYLPALLGVDIKKETTIETS